MAVTITQHWQLDIAGLNTRERIRLPIRMIRKTYKYRLYPTKRQIEVIEGQLAEACRLYNAALQERRDAWRIERKSIGLYDQTYQLKEIRAAGDVGIPNYNVARDVLCRVDRAFKAFFRRLKGRQGKAGYPRFRPERRYASITFEKYADGCKLISERKLRLQGVGEVKIKLHRPIDGTIKTLSIKREAGRWYAAFSVECEPDPLPTSDARVGIDVGLTAFATFDDGTEIENPCWCRVAQVKLRRVERKVARRKKGSNRRRKAVTLLQKVHAHVRSQRADFHHKVSRWLVDHHGLIAVEDLNVRGLAKGILAKSVHDAGWAQFLNFIAYKAESAGRVFVKGNPRGTSQRCPCGASVPKDLKQRRHKCEACGLDVGRDHAAAMEILRLGLSLQAVT